MGVVSTPALEFQVLGESCMCQCLVLSLIHSNLGLYHLGPLEKLRETVSPWCLAKKPVKPGSSRPPGGAKLAEICHNRITTRGMFVKRHFQFWVFPLQVSDFTSTGGSVLQCLAFAFQKKRHLILPVPSAIRLPFTSTKSSDRRLPSSFSHHLLHS